MVKDVTKFVGIDIYENCYYLQNDALHKSSLKNDYKNIEYGTPDVIDISNPLQILLLYKFFNKVILLDNQLSFINEFDVPIGTELIANASKDKIWIYDNIKMILKLYNFKTQKTEISSIPIKEKILQLKGNLNQAIIINGNNQLTKYNYLARKEATINIQNNLLPISLNNTYIIKENILHHKNNKIIDTPNEIESFEVINKKLYFFKKNKIYTLSIYKN